MVDGNLSNFSCSYIAKIWGGELGYVVIWGRAIILGTFLDCSRIFRYHFFGQIFFVWESPRFLGADLDNYKITYVAECCLQGSCFLFSSVRCNLFL